MFFFCYFIFCSVVFLFLPLLLTGRSAPFFGDSEHVPSASRGVYHSVLMPSCLAIIASGVYIGPFGRLNNVHDERDSVSSPDSKRLYSHDKSCAVPSSADNSPWSVGVCSAAVLCVSRVPLLSPNMLANAVPDTCAGDYIGAVLPSTARRGT